MRLPRCDVAFTILKTSLGGGSFEGNANRSGWLANLTAYLSSLCQVALWFQLRAALFARSETSGAGSQPDCMGAALLFVDRLQLETER
jgi:hypothetical protein